MRELVIVGAGGFGRETAQLVAVLPGVALRGFLDDDPALGEVDGFPVLGGTADPPADTDLVVCAGSPGNIAVRSLLVDRLNLPPERFATLIHPSCQVSATSKVGPGSVLQAQCALTASVQIGAHVAIMPQVVLTHDDVLEDFVTIASGVRLSGNVRVGRGAYVGTGALVREGLTIGPGALVGMGAVVTRDIPAGEVWAGVPARFLRPVRPKDNP
jgi:sugar O-acyltransferase (sialic acid O-acetyltransferase NeuD family)